MTVHPHSLAAYELVDLGARQAQVLDAIGDLHDQGWKPCDSDIANYLCVPVSWVTPRRGELEALGVILPAGDKIGDAGRKVTIWAPVAIQLDMFGVSS